MIVADLLNQLDSAGVLHRLYQAGLINLKAYNHRDIYLHWQALVATPQYADQPEQAKTETARQIGVSPRTVRRAIQEMAKKI